MQPTFLDTQIKLNKNTTFPKPIFIIGMPRSGTTLVEQIVSLHSRITGAGELNYIENLGAKFAVGKVSASTETISKFRQEYLVQLAKRSEGQKYVIDKMPQNFKYTALI